MLTPGSDLDTSVRLGLLIAGHFAIFFWTRHVVAPAKAGLSRFLRALLLAPLLLFLTTLFSGQKTEEISLALYSVVTFLWLTPFKILAFCMNRGQLVKAYDSGSTSAFALGLLIPITVAFHEERVSKDIQEASKKCHAYKDARFSVARFGKEEYAKVTLSLLVCVIAKVAFMIALRYGRHYFEESRHLFWRDVCFGWYVYANTSGIEDFISLFLLLTLDIKLEPSFDRPWLSQSVRELWSRRYNLVFGISLRDIAYDPICEGCYVRGVNYFDRRSSSKFQKSIALSTTFVVSGIMHSFIAWAVYMSTIPILSAVFFLANGIILLLENLFKHILSTQKFGLKVSKTLPAWLCQIYVMFTILMLGHYFFFPECVKSGFLDALMDGGLPFLPRN